MTAANDTAVRELVESVVAGDRRALARGITMVENRRRGRRGLLAGVYPDTGSAAVIGVTGPPGVGKSSLVHHLSQQYLGAGCTVGVIAVDPTSPFSGGALLGDRIRMAHSEPDPGLFIRSLATRGHLGGLSRATGDVIHLMDAAGRDVVLVETVGAGQSEVEVMKYVDTTVVVLAPGMGDDVQAIKAGILEIGEVFAVNKADRQGAVQTARQIEVMLELNHDGGWLPPVVKTTAAGEVDGIEELRDAVASHRAHLRDSGEMDERRRRQAAAQLRDLIQARLLADIQGDVTTADRWQQYVAAVAARETDPYSAVEAIWTGLRSGEHGA